MADERAFEGKEVGGVGKDGVELIGAEGFDRLVNRADLDDVATVAKRVDNRTIGSRLPGEDENFVARALQREKMTRSPPTPGHYRL